VAVGVVGIGFALFASSTHPFTTAGDVVTAVPLGVALVVVVRQWSRPGARLRARAPRGVEIDAPAWGRRWIAPLATLVAVAAWELYCFAHLPRTAHPTLSSLIDMLDSTRAGKAVAIAAWLLLGWFLVVS
jgi:hypothetical protein